jgi:predicted O-methyltransferase YrrM
LPSDAALDERLVASFLGDGEALDRYAGEIEESGLIAHLDEQAALFWKTTEEYRAQGLGYNTGRITGRTGYGYGEGIRLYAIVRELRPGLAVETGVCNGVSTAFLLLALERNEHGALYSIDLPEYAGVDYEPGTFWEGKRGAVIPRGKEPGWMIPDALRERWTLVVGRSEEELPPLLERLGTIDLFLHDSEHTYECMSFELRHAFAALRDGGVLAADDVDANAAFFEVATEHEREAVPLGEKMAFLVK